MTTIGVIGAGAIGSAFAKVLASKGMAAASKDGLPPGLMDVHAIRRMATVEEVAAGILFLAGPSAGYITGSVLDVSGGYLA